MISLGKNNILQFIKSFLLSSYALIVLFLYTYATKVNGGAIYVNYAIILLYLGILLYLFFLLIGKKEIIKLHFGVLDAILSSFLICLILSSLLYPNGFFTNINISTMLILMYSLIKVLQYKTEVIGIYPTIKIYEFIFNIFIVFMLLSTIVALLHTFYNFSVFAIPDIENHKRIQSWFSNSTMYGINLSLAIIMTYYKYTKNKNLIFLILALWLVYWLILSGGRTGIIMLIIGFIVNLFFQYKKNILFLLGVIFTLGITFEKYLYSYLTKNFLLFRRFEQGGLGSRDEKAQAVFEYWSNLNIFNQIFGSGTNSLIEKYVFSAHSGYLRLFFEYGIIFMIIYIFFIIWISKKYIVAIRNENDKKLKNLLITGFSLVCMFFVADTTVIISISPLYDFSFLLIFSALPFITTKLSKKRDVE